MGLNTIEKPTCKSCKKSDKVVKVSYANEWLGYECERCYEVVAEISCISMDTGKEETYKPYRLTQ